jgi:ferritin-like metal-binding protein YciE
MSKHLCLRLQHLDRVFHMLGEEPSGVDCPAIGGIINEAKQVSGAVDAKSILNAAILAAAHAVEHYDMTRYGTLIAWARQLGRDDCARVLEQTLAEEHSADEKLTKLAEGDVNRRAA